jgi:hypothetical protein
MGNVMNSVVVEARDYAFGMGSDPGAIAKISATPASAPGTAVFYSGEGNLAKAKACVANLYMSGRSGYTYDQTPAGFLAGLHGDGRLTALASAKMGAEATAAIAFVAGSPGGFWDSWELPALKEAGVNPNYYTTRSCVWQTRYRCWCLHRRRPMMRPRTIGGLWRLVQELLPGLWSQE